MIKYPEISPVMVQIGPIALRWYGFMYAVGFVFLSRTLHRLAAQKFIPLDSAQVEKLFLRLVITPLFLARVFYVLFYEPALLNEPSEVLAIWHGGLSYHGGFLGVAVASFWSAYEFRGQKNVLAVWLSIIDGIALCAPVGVGCGRLGNFINGELFGRVSSVPWAMVFPQGGVLARHPSQLYEFFLEGPLLLFFLWRVLKPRVRRYGFIAMSHLAWYACARIFVEFFREPDAQLGFILGPFTMGQLLSLGIFVFVAAIGFSIQHLSKQHNPEVDIQNFAK